MTDKKSERLALFASFIGKELDEFAPSVTRWLGGVLQDVKNGEFTVQYTVRAEMTNPLGMLHGGIHAAIIDDQIGMTVYALGYDEPYVSINLSVDFIGPARTGDKVIARSKVTREGKQIINAICELFDANGNLISRGTSNMVRIARKPK